MVVSGAVALVEALEAGALAGAAVALEAVVPQEVGNANSTVA